MIRVFPCCINVSPTDLLYCGMCHSTADQNLVELNEIRGLPIIK